MFVDVRVGKMLIFGCMLKCFDLVFMIVVLLSGWLLFMLFLEKWEEVVVVRMKLVGNSKSDYMVIVVVYSGWVSVKIDGWFLENDYC